MKALTTLAPDLSAVVFTLRRHMTFSVCHVHIYFGFCLCARVLTQTTLDQPEMEQHCKTRIASFGPHFKNVFEYFHPSWTTPWPQRNSP